VPITALSPFERPHLPFERVNEATLLIQLAPLLIQVATHIFCGTNVPLQGGAGTIKLFNGGHTTSELGQILLLLGEFPLLLVDNTHVSLPVTGQVLCLCLPHSKYRLSSTIKDFQVSAAWRGEYGDTQLAVAVPHLDSPTCLPGFGAPQYLASVINDVHTPGAHHLGRCSRALCCETYTQDQHHAQSQA
jgi:hypothetical protein